MQRTVILFDQSLGKLGQNSEDEILLYLLLTCLYLSLKVENRVMGLPFDNFLNMVAQLPSYVAL